MRHFLILLSVLGLFAGPALADRAQDRIATEYLQAAVTGQPEAVLSFYHPAEIDDLRIRVLKVLEEEATKGSDTIRRNVFGVATSLENIRRTTPANLFLMLAKRVGMPAEKIDSVKVLGAIDENSQSAHVVARLMPPKDSGGRAHLTLVSLIRYGKDWRVALPFGLQARVDALMAGQNDRASTPPAASATPNTADINQLLEESSNALREGDCAGYFNDHMSPAFRSSTSVKALQTLISQCKKSEDTRGTYLEALELAKRLSPIYENNGARAVYDMKGQGLPFQRFVLQKSGDRWYIAE